ncbi:hypothetical protein [Bosea sp. BIWAKO-01]|nr:hypothetical protein [Bosea sp. BIWAKO-01]
MLVEIAAMGGSIWSQRREHRPARHRVVATGTLTLQSHNVPILFLLQE